MNAATAFAHYPHAARLLFVYEGAQPLTWASLEENADRVEAVERITAEMRAVAEDDWQAALLNAVERENER